MVYEWATAVCRQIVGNAGYPHGLCVCDHTYCPGELMASELGKTKAPIQLASAKQNSAQIAIEPEQNGGPTLSVASS